MRIVDLFAGIGGFGLGAQRAGGDLCLSVEIDPTCCETIAQNHLGKGTANILREDVRVLRGADIRDAAGLGKRGPLVIVGGAPCQPFSKAAYWLDPGDEAAYRKARAQGRRISRPTRIIRAKRDDRRGLVGEFLRLVCESVADGFVFENVPSILHPRNRRLMAELQEAFEKNGYRTRLIRANAAEFGVPQVRQRVFLLGSRADEPIEPTPTHYWADEPVPGRRKAVTAGKALAGLDRPEYFEPEEVVKGRWARHLATVPPGWNYKFHSAWAGHPRPTFEAERKFWSFLLKLSPDRPSWTLAANPGPWVGPFHWDSRRLRTVEMAALQGFPRKFQVAGTRRERVRQIGNAVPPPLAAVMVEAILATLSSSRRSAVVRWPVAVSR